jgi:redox-sensing transcriptional repressor
MKGQISISPAVIKRLPRYKRCLTDLKKKGVERVSSGSLSDILGYTASQIRQDLNNFGGFGQQGYGYNVTVLGEEINAILGLGRIYKVAIVGIGNMGQAVTGYLSAYHSKFKVDALFDMSDARVGSQVQGITVRHVDELGQYLAENHPEIGIITVSKESAQSVADALIAGGVHGIWNFVPVDLVAPPHIVLQYEHLSNSLYELVYYMNSTKDEGEDEDEDENVDGDEAGTSVEGNQ